MPRELLPAARREWRRVAPELQRLGLLTVVDGPSLAAYCQCYARWLEAEEHLREHGRVVVIRSDKGEVRNVLPSPYVGIAVKMLEKLRQFAADFGLNPAVRSTLGAPLASQPDPFEEFLKQQRV
jgi:P27 family predicted phage terminase small subunit